VTWFIHWDPSFDLAKGGVELSFRKSEDMAHLLVETEAVRSVMGIAKNIKTPNISSRYHIIGARGFGKSTLLNFVAFSLYSNIQSQRVIPVYASLLGTASQEKELEFVFFRSLLQSLFDIPTDMKRFYPKDVFAEPMARLASAEEEYKKKLKEFGAVTLEFVYEAFENQLKHLREHFDKIVFLIDGLDKQDTDVVLGFLRNTQERFNTIINKYDCVFIDAADPSWRATLDSKEYSGVRGITTNLRGWTADEVEALIRKRLERIGIFETPFDRRALDILVEDFQGNPREILQYATTLLHYAVKERHRTIGPGIARKIVWSDDSKDKFFNKLISDTNMRYAFEKLKDLYPQRQVMNILIGLYYQRNRILYTNLDYAARTSIGITLSDIDFKRNLENLIAKGCLRRSKASNFVELEDDLFELLDYAVQLGQSLVALPVILSELESKVRTAAPRLAEEVIIKDEVQRILEQHPTEWLDYKRIKELILENPRTAQKVKDYFKENHDKKITRTIPLIVHKLMENGQIMIDKTTSSYRWRPSWIDYETTELFGEREILDKIDLAERALSVGKSEDLVKYCGEIFWFSFLRLNNLFGGRIDISNVESVRNFLKSVKINVEKPVPFSLYVSSLKEAFSDMDEAKLRLQFSMLYAKRIYSKIHELSKYEARNQEIIDKLTKYSIGKTKECERRDFNMVFLPLLLKHYGKLVDLMTSLKVKEGLVENIPPELNFLLENKHVSKAKLCECPVCKTRTILCGETAMCQQDKAPLKFVKEGFVLSNRAYQAWNVWMEEYTRYALQDLPCKKIESGLSIRPLESVGVVTPEEIDVVIVYNGICIAIECMENVSLSEERNDILDILHKTETLRLFDAIILVYRFVDNQHNFGAIVQKNRKFLNIVQVQSPTDFKAKLLETLSTAEQSLSKD